MKSNIEFSWRISSINAIVSTWTIIMEMYLKSSFFLESKYKCCFLIHCLRCVLGTIERYGGTYWWSIGSMGSDTCRTIGNDHQNVLFVDLARKKTVCSCRTRLLLLLVPWFMLLSIVLCQKLLFQATENMEHGTPNWEKKVFFDQQNVLKSIML